MKSNEKLNLLNEKSAWAYTKQAANFKDVFNSARLFSEIPDKKHTKIEKYFAENHENYDLEKDRHRILAICQMFGLITKSTYYSKKSNYCNEEITPVFKVLKNEKIGSEKYNKIFSEQLLKIKIKAIIDVTDNRNDYHIYPFLFLFLTMYNLKVSYCVYKVSLDKIWTYVLTCKSMDELDNTINYLIDPNSKTSKFISQYKSDSRILTLILENTKMFIYDNKNNMLSLNQDMAEDFYDNFIKKQNLTLMESYLLDDIKYQKFLNNLQNFDFDLTKDISKSKKKKPNIVVKKTEKDEKIEIVSKYPEDIDNILEELIDLQENNEVESSNSYSDEKEIETANNRVPVLNPDLKENKRYKTDSRLAKTAIKNAGFVCELNSKLEGNHSTFETKNGKYLEAHHLIPMKFQKDFISLNINLDRLENIVALCPNCHRAIHYGTRQEKEKYLKPLYNDRIQKLKEIGIEVDFDTLLNEFYKD